MRRMRALTSFVAIAAASMVCQADAAQAREPWARAGEWKVIAVSEGVCQAAREFESGSRLAVTHYDGSAASIGVFNRAWPIRVSKAYTLSLVQSGARQGFAAVSNYFAEGLGVTADAGNRLLAQLSAGGIVEVTSPDGVLLERLDLSGLAPALAYLRPCRVAATEAYFEAGAPPRPVSGGETVNPNGTQGRFASLFLNSDYPPSRFARGSKAPSCSRIDIGEDGRVGACTITASSGSAALDSTTCRLVRWRARFRPARDAAGKPKQTSMTGRVVWRLPEPVSPPS